MAPEDASIRVQLVDRDVAEVLEQLHPARMVRKNPQVQHLRVAEHQVGTTPNGAVRVLGCIAVVRVRADVMPMCAQAVRELVKLGELILRKRLGWEKIQRAGWRLVEHRAQYRHVVAERLLRCRRRHDDDVSAGQRA